MDFEQLLNTENFDIINITSLAIRFVFNAIMAASIILLVYRRNSNNKDFCFTLFSFNMIIFALCTILNNVNLSIGSGFGLFAVFTMMRYRSEQLQIKDMTYLLILIGLGFVNATVSNVIGPVEIAFLNISTGISLYVLEKLMFDRNLASQKIKYGDLELIKMENRPLLRKDLESRLGARVAKIDITYINFMDGFANLIVKYNPHSTARSNHYMLKNKQKNNHPTLEKEDHVLLEGT
jgi:hypothetical protein